ncbi:MAG: ABC transporter permease [Planctomycetes bacterium]|nr:ABC transporter permease [Planctomycetota bacterium]
MNLALRDVRHGVGRFGLTALGIGMLLMVVMGMGGIYRGIVEDAVLLVDRVGADVWVVQRDTRGPFAEQSRVPPRLVRRLEAVPGVADARGFVYHTVQREHAGRPLRLAVVGLDWPEDRGEWVPLVAGRPLQQGHLELVADRSLGLALGERVRLGREVHVVVGISAGMISSAGDGVAFLSASDALALAADVPPEHVRLERAARRARAGRLELALVRPELLAQADATAGALPALPPPSLSAALVRLRPGVSAQEVAAVIDGWADVRALTADEQRALLLGGSVAKVRAQIGLFRALLTVIAAIVMALILYTLTLDKLHAIALLKLIGAPTRVVLGLILQQALLLGALGYGVALAAGAWLFPRFPRRVILTPEDLVALAAVVLCISIAASALGVARALRVSPAEALAA